MALSLSRMPRRATSSLLAAAVTVSLGVSALAADRASAVEWYYGPVTLLPYSADLPAFLTDALTDEPHSVRRGKWTSGNGHSTRISYNWPSNYLIFENTDNIPAHSTTSKHFTTAHPGYFGPSGVYVHMRARNLGPNTITPRGKALL
ncbi:hypothetical protein [Patulibacter defluvii]|uniref:hypothetical protein n=1 Tax=Patulibacter defluvii TaxID=3095358 RepID=UPI002A75390A|nr:hypothetical protein [Patulibacter sp. DM4]